MGLAAVQTDPRGHLPHGRRDRFSRPASEASRSLRLRFPRLAVLKPTSLARLDLWGSAQASRRRSNIPRTQTWQGHFRAAPTSSLPHGGCTVHSSSARRPTHQRSRHDCLRKRRPETCAACDVTSGKRSRVATPVCMSHPARRNYESRGASRAGAERREHVAGGRGW